MSIAVTRPEGFVFFSTKPAPAGDEDERMMTAANVSLMYFSMALVSGAYRVKIQPLGEEEPGRRLMPQAYGC